MNKQEQRGYDITICGCCILMLIAILFFCGCGSVYFKTDRSNLKIIPVRVEVSKDIIFVKSIRAAGWLEACQLCWNGSFPAFWVERFYCKSFRGSTYFLRGQNRNGINVWWNERLLFESFDVTRNVDTKRMVR